LAFKIRGQICDPRTCIAFTKKVSLTRAIVAGEVRPEYAEAAKVPGMLFETEVTAADPQAAIPVTRGPKTPWADGLVGYLVLAVLAGFGALATPCVFPMIPITVAFFSKFSETSVRRTAGMAGLYMGSIVTTFTILGVVVSLVFGAVGMQAISSSVEFNAFIGLLLVVFAFNLFGMFEIKIPGWLVNKTAAAEHELGSKTSLGSQALGVIFMGLTFTLISFTCTVGFIGLVLAEAAKGDAVFPAIGMFAFSLAFSLPFFVLALAPSWANTLQGKAGGWMVSVKVVLGFVELAGAFKFLSNIDLVRGWGWVTRDFVLAGWVAVFLVCGLYLLKIFALSSDAENAGSRVSPPRMAFAMLFLALSGYSLSGIGTTKSMGGWLDGWLPPAVYPGMESVAASGGGGVAHAVVIKDDIPGSLAKGREDQRPVFIDFTGYTCTNCRYMEASVFPLPAVASRLAQMVRSEVYTDCIQDVCDEQREYQVERFETAALPFYAVLDPSDDSIMGTFASSTNDSSEFVEFLDAALSVYNAKHPAAAKAEAAAPPKVEALGKVQAESQGEELPPVEFSAVGEEVNLELPHLKDGSAFSLSSLRGQWALVNFWASWCAPCKQELREDFPPALKKHAHVKLVTVAFDGEDGREEAMSFANEAKLFDHIALLGPADIEEAGLHAAFGTAASLPQTFVIDPTGKLVFSVAGSITEQMLEAMFVKMPG
jgi:thiol:disulfide interchange protein DsbD